MEAPLNWDRGFTKREKQALRPKEHKIPNKEEREFNGAWILLIIIALASIIVYFGVEPHGGIFSPTVAHAQSPVTHKKYPLTNAGTCERLKDEGMAVYGASMQETITRCANYGVQL